MRLYRPSACRRPRAAALALAAATGCVHREPPQWGAVDASVAPLPPNLALAPPPPSSSALAAPLAAGEPGAAPEGDVAVVATPTLADAGEEDAGALPQTHDEPQPSGPRFDAGVAALWQAIVDDDPDRALPFFFPLAAYEQVKAIASPARDWRVRLVAAYKRDIHDLHLKLGPRAARAKLLRAEVPMAKARWVEPGEEYNRIGYYRVFGTKLRGDADGHPVVVDVTSLISWRGEWYCVHLSGIK
jgi:hypothetical protein